MRTRHELIVIQVHLRRLRELCNLVNSALGAPSDGSTAVVVTPPEPNDDEQVGLLAPPPGLLAPGDSTGIPKVLFTYTYTLTHLHI